MLRYKYAKIILLLGILSGALFTYYISQDPKPVVIFKGETTYYIPGKNKRCDWVAYMSRVVFLKFTSVFPQLKKVGQFELFYRFMMTQRCFHILFPIESNHFP